MRIIYFFFYALLGSGLALLFLVTQHWTAKVINPEIPKLSKWLVVGGAVIRWLLIFIILLVVLSNSLLAMLVVFSAFMIARILILLNWQKSNFVSLDKSPRVKG